ncbi:MULTISPECIES: STM3941 family protein [unclassified Empedobacter]|uniref:STM3941 family protein n=1 Tax=unclassified Empedobacter TaxID=2643773 RepID=UPI002446E74D|nr:MULTISPECIES: STM3941 family protein [unclassified Empedobacter]MDH0675798.1 hypothetical protein [Empedobacter sp. GD03861]
MSEIIIEKSNEKIIGLILFFILSNILSIFMIFNSNFFVSKFIQNDILIFIGGIIGFIYTFAMVITHIILLLNKEKGIILTNFGITDNSNYESLGYIKWDDISHIKTVKTYSGEYLELSIKNKKNYIINNNISLLKRLLIVMNNWHPNETIILNSRKLNCTFQELEASVITKWEKRDN